MIRVLYIISLLICPLSVMGRQDIIESLYLMPVEHEGEFHRAEVYLLKGVKNPGLGKIPR